MTSDYFIESLRKKAPKNEELLLIGLEKHELDSILKGYYGKKKGNSLPRNSVLDDLIENYDLTSIEIGMFSFESKIVGYGDYLHFGYFETDWIVENKVTKEIILVEEESLHIMNYCARDIDAFMQSLLECAEVLTQCMLEDAKYEDGEYLKNESLRIAEIAGNRDKYYDFYATFLNVSF